jgi:hypothetical protein
MPTVLQKVKSQESGDDVEGRAAGKGRVFAYDAYVNSLLPTSFATNFRNRK